MILVLHANWTGGALHLWAESPSAAGNVAAREPMSSRGGGVALAAPTLTHPLAVDPAVLLDRLADARVLPFAAADQDRRASVSTIHVRLPADESGVWPSDHLRLLTAAPEPIAEPALQVVEIPTLALPGAEALNALLAMETAAHDQLDLSASVRYFIRIARLAFDLLESQRFIPTLVQTRANGLSAAWHPWLHDDEARRAIAALLAAMPPVVRAVVDNHHAQPWPILEDALGGMVDGFVRETLISDSFMDALDGRDSTADPQVAWLGGLLGGRSSVDVDPPGDSDLLRDAGEWVGRLVDVGQDRPLHLLLHLHEPLLEPEDGKAQSQSDPLWRLSLHLQSSDDPRLVIDAQTIWSGLAPPEARGGSRNEHGPEQLLLAELGRVSRIWPRMESVLLERAPTHVDLTTAESYEFLRDFLPVLGEAGVKIVAPSWWNQPLGRLGARLQIEAPPADKQIASAGGAAPAASMLGLNSIVRYRWQVAIGDQPLTAEEFDRLARQSAPLVRVRGRWIEINPQQLQEAREFILASPAGEMTLLAAIQTAHGASSAFGSELPVFGMDASGWVADVLNASSDDRAMPQLTQPSAFVGSLRPYQKSGLSWMAFLDRYGLGACLADDMGLGKTIQFIAMLLHERGIKASEHQGIKGEHSLDASVGPTLLIVPTSVVENWVRELGRFAPTLKVHVHHGPDRVMGDRFAEVAQQHDLVITTYPLVARDHETLRRLTWHRVTLDEAQYIKNPPTKQTSAIRSLQTPRRLALTGTPVENRLSELWSIMEFLNPGYLGTSGEFRRRFAVPIERHRNQRLAERLRNMVRPFILRRLKTDPTVIDDLPPCLETKEFATLTPQQAALYQHVVSGMLGEVDRATGIQRRGLVLATLVKLKQICNHPAQFLKATGNGDWEAAADTPVDQQIHHEQRGESGPETDQSPPPVSVINALHDENHLAARSGKARRLLTMLEEVFATGEKALVFTQFRQMGHLLAAMIQHELEVEPLFLHGGTPVNKRQHLIDRFQNPHGGAPVFILSLKAGGLGLNLTAASHVFHFDRWWNPAVENQATDRAFRIGQTRTVHVHKFVCVGTLEERIDQMIEQKTELAQNIIGAGEAWLTELSTGQLRDMLTLRTSAMEGDS